MLAASTNRTLPAHTGPWLDWKTRTERKVAPHNGATDGFTYMFPTQKYVEAYAGKGFNSYGSYVNYLNYNHAHQPYDYKDAGLNVAFRTPRLPNWYMMAKVSPKSSMPGIQQAQNQISAMLAANKPFGSIIGNP